MFKILLQLNTKVCCHIAEHRHLLSYLYSSHNTFVPLRILICKHTIACAYILRRFKRLADHIAQLGLFSYNIIRSSNNTFL